MDYTIGHRLERYTIKHPQEVLLVTAEIDGELDQVAIFRGYSSSLMRPTAFDPDVPVLSENSRIIKIDRVRSPYNPENPHYLEQGLNLEAIQKLLAVSGV
ncbi:hypothetical protein BST81_08765 [Leptolyngbya sp. 'hensonii']|uniref:DUF7734 family protein n=1 Tax=Leptolyngbya sp. 'hensonii' TaxID=1922337 RepID=UPI00094FF796|nr:hypothetical protein [Leptolyngbya sp. 'hensonii']OLP18817.1 hypothetical protein BST81_08765 [Leptolyngbya sp. 'hensonii']